MGLAVLSDILEIFGKSSPDGQTQEQLYREVLLMTLARASRSDANIHPAQIETIQRIMQTETGQEVTELDIRKAARSELYESVSLRKYLRDVQHRLTVEQKIVLVRTLAEVIRSDTNISVLEIDFFNRVADVLRVTPAELIGLTH